MHAIDFDVDDLAERVTLIPGVDPATWPSINLAITFQVHSPEPDVGLFSPTVDIQTVTYNLDGESYTDEDAFANDLHDAISEDIEEDAAFLRSCIREIAHTWEQNFEPDA